jgi:acetyl-CoA carboxylase biotin carboxyl carrier protein
MAFLKVDEAVFDKLAEILKKHNLSEIEYKRWGTKIKITASSSEDRSILKTVCLTNHIEERVTETKDSSPPELSYDNHTGAVKSPMVGTCYMAPEPGAQNFVNVGDMVQEGQPLLIIEAMKVMNVIKAPKSGKIIHIAITNTNPVEFNQLLMVIE